jgi:transcriptional regulator with XRE-family HTH domain
MSSQEVVENAKIAVALRAARSAIGWNQQEFADKMGVAKSTVARIETLEMGAKADFLIRAIQLFRQAGVEVDLAGAISIRLDIGQAAVLGAVAALEDESKRRSDRKTGLIASAMNQREDL